MKQYFLLDQNEQKGPFTLEELKAQGLTRQTLVWSQGMEDWLPASQIKDLIPVLGVAPTPPPAPGQLSGVNQDPFDFDSKNRKPQIEHTEPSVPASKIHTLWKAYSITWWTGLIMIPLIIGIAVALEVSNDFDDELVAIFSVLFGMLAMGLLVTSFIMHLVILYRGWENIQDGHPRAEPAKAVGFLFIPYYNFYWVFQAYKGFGEDLNQYCIERGYSEEPVCSENLLTTGCVFRVLMAIPYLNVLAMFPGIIIDFLMLRNIKDGVAFLLDQKAQAVAREHKIEW